MVRRIGRWLSSSLDWLFQDLRDPDILDEETKARKDEIESLKRAGVPAFRLLRVTLRHHLLRSFRSLLLLLVFGLLFMGALVLLAPAYEFLEPHLPIIRAAGKWIFLVVLLILLIGSPLYLARDLFKSDGGDVTDPDDGIGVAVLLVFLIPAWLIVLALLAHYYLTWLQVVLVVLCVPVSLIALFIWTTLKEDRPIK
jgi:hypothetical protein